jgi:hypothetical protein
MNLAEFVQADLGKDFRLSISFVSTSPMQANSMPVVLNRSLVWLGFRPGDGFLLNRDQRLNAPPC